MSNDKEPKFTNVKLAPSSEPVAYLPKFMYATIPLPKDTSTDAEKECDAFLLFATDVAGWGFQDAVGLWRALTKRPLPAHPGDCRRCPTRPMSILFPTSAVHRFRVSDTIKDFNERNK